MIYFAQVVDGGPIKIGTTVDVEQRIAALQWASPWPIRLIGQCDGGQKEEAWLHKQLKHARMSGEWFNSEDAMPLIKRVLSSDFQWPDLHEVIHPVVALILRWPKPSVANFARDLGIPTEHAGSIKRRKSIPIRHWPAVIAAAERLHFFDVNPELLMRVHLPQDTSQEEPEASEEPLEAEAA